MPNSTDDRKGSSQPEAKRGPGRPPYVPTEHELRMVEQYEGTGIKLARMLPSTFILDKKRAEARKKAEEN